MKEPLHGSKFLMAETAHERLPESVAEVAFIGRSNVGKSSLINALTNNWKLARMSKTPGQTRSINVYEVKPNRWIVDMPGYGYAVGPARERGYWPEMIGKYLGERSALKRAYVVIDSDVGPTDIDRSMLNWLGESGIPHRIVAGKTDKVGGSKIGARKNQIASELNRPAADFFWISAKDGRGVSPLQQDVIAALEL